MCFDFVAPFGFIGPTCLSDASTWSSEIGAQGDLTMVKDRLLRELEARDVGTRYRLASGGDTKIRTNFANDQNAALRCEIHGISFYEGHFQRFSLYTCSNSKLISTVTKRGICHTNLTFVTPPSRTNKKASYSVLFSPLDLSLKMTQDKLKTSIPASKSRKRRTKDRDKLSLIPSPTQPEAREPSNSCRIDSR